MKMQAEACNFIKKETLAQVFSYEFCEISKNTDKYKKTSKEKLTNFLAVNTIFFQKASEATVRTGS